MNRLRGGAGGDDVGVVSDGFVAVEVAEAVRTRRNLARPGVVGYGYSAVCRRQLSSARPALGVNVVVRVYGCGCEPPPTGSAVVFSCG